MTNFQFFSLGKFFHYVNISRPTLGKCSWACADSKLYRCRQVLEVVTRASNNTFFYMTAVNFNLICFMFRTS